MITSFNDKEAEKIFNGIAPKRLPLDIQARTFNKLTTIHAANAIEDLRMPPSSHLEALKGDRKGQYSLRINDQYQVCFHWNAEFARIDQLGIPENTPDGTLVQRFTVSRKSIQTGL